LAPVVDSWKTEADSPERRIVAPSSISKSFRNKYSSNRYTKQGTLRGHIDERDRAIWIHVIDCKTTINAGSAIGAWRGYTKRRAVDPQLGGG